MQAVEAVAQQDGVLAACKALCGTWWDLWSQAHGVLGICCLDDTVHVLRGRAAVGTLVAAPELGPAGLEVRADEGWLALWGGGSRCKAFSVHAGLRLLRTGMLSTLLL